MENGWSLWRERKKDLAAAAWKKDIESNSSDSTKASAHAGLGIYYAEKGKKKKSLYHANLAMEITPQDAIISYAMNMNALGISLAKNKDYTQAELILKKVADVNERYERSNNPIISLQRKHQRAKNGYNLAYLVYLPKKKPNLAVIELEKEVIPRYKAVLQAGVIQAGSDLAAAYHRLSESYDKLADKADPSKKKQMIENALKYESKSLDLWEIHAGNDFDRIENAKNNIEELREKAALMKAASKKHSNKTFQRTLKI